MFSERENRLKATMDPGDYAAKLILDRISDELPTISVARDIVVCALLYLEGDRQPGNTVARWWKHEDDADEAFKVFGSRGPWRFPPEQ